MTLPTIPDNFYKVLILTGIFCLGFGYFEDNHNFDHYFSILNLYKTSIDSLDIELTKIDHQRKKLYKVADRLSKRNNIPNPISINDSLIIFKQAIIGANKEVIVSDSLLKIWDEYKEADFGIELFQKQIRIRKEALSQAKEEYKAAEDTNYWINFLGGVSLILGFFGMMRYHDIQEELLERQLSEKPKIYRYCQSCGKKFSAMRRNSKNSDGTSNPAFCTNCYVEGQFTETELTSEEFMKRSAVEVKKRKTWLTRKFLSNRLKHLERWDTDNYL